MVDAARYPERLRIVVYNQFDVNNDWDLKLNQDLKDYIEQVTKLPNAPTILIEGVWHENAKNVYHARQMIQRHYDGETYQM